MWIKRPFCQWSIGHGVFKRLIESSLYSSCSISYYVLYLLVIWFDCRVYRNHLNNIYKNRRCLTTEESSVKKSFSVLGSNMFFTAFFEENIWKKYICQVTWPRLYILCIQCTVYIVHCTTFFFCFRLYDRILLETS